MIRKESEYDIFLWKIIVGTISGISKVNSLD